MVWSGDRLGRFGRLSDQSVGPVGRSDGRAVKRTIGQPGGRTVWRSVLSLRAVGRPVGRSVVGWSGCQANGRSGGRTLWRSVRSVGRPVERPSIWSVGRVVGRSVGRSGRSDGQAHKFCCCAGPEVAAQSLRETRPGPDSAKIGRCWIAARAARLLCGRAFNTHNQMVVSPTLNNNGTNSVGTELGPAGLDRRLWGAPRNMSFHFSAEETLGKTRVASLA